MVGFPRNIKHEADKETGLHFSPLGYRVLCNQVKAAIQRFYPALTGPALDSPFPSWREINGIAEE